MAKKTTIGERLATLEEQCKNILTEVGECKINLTNHLEHHWQFTLALLGAVGIEAVAFLVLVIKHVL